MIRALALALLLGGVRVAAADCHLLDVKFTVADDSGNSAAPYHLRPQIVVWLEDAQGHYVDTLYITQQTGTFGLGNRPGQFDFNSGPMWPFGRRITVFPVWSHLDKTEQLARTGHAYPFPQIVFQNGDESALSHSPGESSGEPHFCRPIKTDEPLWGTALDAGSCATQAYTDKGKRSSSRTTGYPPRVDVTGISVDSADVDLFPQLNPFDTVSRATPAIGAQADVTWLIRPDQAPGDYVVKVEVSKELDYNATYNDATYPAPFVAYGDYGVPYRGQPSVVYAVPIAISPDSTSAITDAYAGYGDPDGADGTLRAPDATITTGVQGSGAARLALIADGAAMYRVRVATVPGDDAIVPGAAGELATPKLSPTTATISFVAPGDDGATGKVRSYEIRYRVGTMDESTFAAALLPKLTPAPDDPGQVQTVDLDGLLPETDYSVGVRAYDECQNPGPLAVVTFTTPARPVGEVDACFVATAAYGSAMANEVGMLRAFRDAVLRNTVLGELFVETYYTFGPAVANVVGESELLRATAREALGPLVHYVGR